MVSRRSKCALQVWLFDWSQWSLINFEHHCRGAWAGDFTLATQQRHLQIKSFYCKINYVLRGKLDDCYKISCSNECDKGDGKGGGGVRIIKWNNLKSLEHLHYNPIGPLLVGNCRSKMKYLWPNKTWRKTGTNPQKVTTEAMSMSEFSPWAFSRVLVSPFKKKQQKNI